MHDVFFVECSAEKQMGTMHAKDLYTSSRFRAARSVAEAASDTWYILSGQHGLIAPDALIESYDRVIADLSDPDCSRWQKQVRAQVAKCCKTGDRLTLLCGDDYVAPLKASGCLDKLSVRSPFMGKARSQRLEHLLGLLGQTERGQQLNRFYEILLEHGSLVTQGRSFGTPKFYDRIPDKGVYFFFEPSQHRMLSKEQRRVIRVGTHGVSLGSKSSLLNRINTHFGTRSGSGNHRSSIMRLHIGAAMLAQGDLGFKVPTWGSKEMPSGQDRELEEKLEQQVSKFIREMDFICIGIGDQSSAKSDRAFIEQNSIALLSGETGPLDVADSQWVGLYSPKAEIRRSNLWNVNEVGGTPTPEFLETLSHYIRVSIGSVPPLNGSIAPENWYDQRRGWEIKGQKRLF